MASILNLARLERKLKRLPDAATAEIKAAMESVAEDIVRLAKSLVPVNDGDLHDSIGWTWGAPPRGALTLGKVARSALGKDLTITVYAGDNRAFYARWVEFGTAPHENGGLFPGTKHPGTSAQPFFYTAYRASRKGAKRSIRKATRAAARKVAAGELMMADPLFELQRALYALLTGDAAVTALVAGRVFDRVTADAAMPYISFGPMTADDDGADCIDGLSVAVQIDVWSQAIGYGEAKEIAGAVRRAIAAADLDLDPHALADISHRSTRILRDPDGITSHAVLTFEASIEAL